MRSDNTLVLPQHNPRRLKFFRHRANVGIIHAVVIITIACLFVFCDIGKRF